MKWLLVIHIFGVIMWLGGLLVVTSMLGIIAGETGAARERMLSSARRLFDSACTIGAVLTILFGLLLIVVEPELIARGWLHLKLLLVVFLLIVHVWLSRRITTLTGNPESGTWREFVAAHGIISLLLLGILFLVVFKPF